MNPIAILCLLFALFQAGFSETGCPDPEEIQPCVCTNSPSTYLDCKHLDDSEILRNVFINSARYTYREVHIEYSALQFLPHDIFDSVLTKQLYLKNVTLLQLFDSPPDALEDLDTLHIENTRINRGVLWELLEPLKHLRILNIYYNSIKTLGRDFSDYATKDLEQLSFYSTETKSISPETFDKFTKLTKVACDAGKLTELSRDIFPTPFLGSVLYFNDNQISIISEDMFSDMPNLQTLGLRNNHIAVFPESALSGSGSKLEYFRLEDNPIKCDCRLQWVTQKNIPVIGGQCISPKELYGKQLKDLTSSDFHC